MNKTRPAAKIFSIALLLLPFITWSGYYEGPKVFWLLTVGLGLTLFWLYRLLVRKQKIIITKVDFFYLAWLAVLLIASIFGVHPFESLIGGSYRHQGVLFFLTLWLVYKTVQLFATEEKDFLYRGLGWAVLAEAVIVFLQFSTGHLYFGKPLGTLGESNAVAGFIAIGAYFVFRSFQPEFFAFPAIAILIAESRSGVLALLPNLVVLIKKVNFISQKLVAFLVVCIGIFVIVLISKERGSSPFENRSLIWQLGLSQVLSRPILGFGAESGEAVYNKAFYQYRLPLSGLIVDRAHNLVLDIAMWSGIIGLLTFTGFGITFFTSLKDKYKKLAFISVLIYSMFQPLSVVHWLFVFLL